MKLFGKMIFVLGVCSMVLGQIVPNKLFLQEVQARDYGLPFLVTTEVIDGDLYLKIEPYQTDGITVEVNGSSDQVIQLYDYNYYYRVKENGEYRIEIFNEEGEAGVQFFTVNLDQEKPELTLQRYYANDEWYIRVTAKDDYKIKEVKMNDEVLSFDEEGGERSFRVKESQNYTVTVEDYFGNVTTEDIFIDVEQKTNAPEVTLDKEHKNSAWYMIINAHDKYGIASVTVNGKEIPFDKTGEIKYIEITKKDTYYVEVKNEDGIVTKKNIYIDPKEKVSIPPEVEVEQIDEQVGSSLQIKVKDNGKILGVTVNDQPITYDENTGIAIYKLKESGIYRIKVKDDEENEVEEIKVVEHLNSEAKHQVVYTLGIKSWTLDGKAQKELDVAPVNMNGRIYVPFRAVAQSFGIDASNVVWHNEQEIGEIKDGEHTVLVRLKYAKIKVDGKIIEIECAPAIIDGRIMLPLSSVAKAFDYKQAQLDWNNNTKQLTISYVG